MAGVLAGVFAEPKPLMGGACEAGDPVAVLPVLYHLLWTRVLAADVTAAPARTRQPGRREAGRRRAGERAACRSVLRVGARVRFDGTAQTVAGLSGTLVRLAGQDGQASVVQLAHLLASEGFEVIGGAGRSRPPLSAAALGGVPGEAAGDALRWERHIIEVLTGAAAGCAAGDGGPARVRPCGVLAGAAGAGQGGRTDRVG